MPTQSAANVTILIVCRLLSAMQRLQVIKSRHLRSPTHVPSSPCQRGRAREGQRLYVASQTDARNVLWFA